MSKSPTIIEDDWSNDPADWLENPHAGAMLESEFLQPLSTSSSELAPRLGMPAAKLEAIVHGRQPIDAEADLRLSRYFGMSEGFFLRLQNSYELLEAKRALRDALDWIVPRAA